MFQSLLENPLDPKAYIIQHVSCYMSRRLCCGGSCCYRATDQLLSSRWVLTGCHLSRVALWGTDEPLCSAPVVMNLLGEMQRRSPLFLRWMYWEEVFIVIEQTTRQKNEVKSMTHTSPERHSVTTVDYVGGQKGRWPPSLNHYHALLLRVSAVKIPTFHKLLLELFRWLRHYLI